MKTLILILISFSSFSQVDTIQPPCELNRQQTRLWYKAIEDAHDLEKVRIRLLDDQHKRNNTKEIKSLRYGYRALKVENQTIRKQFKLTEDSIKRSNRLLLDIEYNRNSEAEKTLRNERISLRNDLKRSKQENKTLRIENRKKLNMNVALIVGGILAILILFLVIKLVRRSK